jgi:Icc-related predicted phosphoesterase
VRRIGMKIIGLSDIHGKTGFIHEIFEDLRSADIVLISGDITHFGREADAQSVIQDINNINDRVFAVPGNCDYLDVQKYLLSKGISLDRRVIKFPEYTLAGIGGSLSCPGITPNEYSEEEFRTHLAEMKQDIPPNVPLFFISHQPPVDSPCDQVRNGMHVGSVAIRDFIIENQPMFCLTGHIHESICMDFMGKTVIINPGPLDSGGFVLIEFSEGIDRINLMRGKEVVRRL